MKRILILLLILAMIVPAAEGCSNQLGFENQRAAVADYLRAYNKVYNDFSDTASAIEFSLNNVPTIPQINSCLTQLLTASQGAWQRANELRTPEDETAVAHLQAFKKYLQDRISTIQNFQAAVSSGKQVAVPDAYSEFKAAAAQATPMNRLTESLMLKYNIADAEVNYQFRGK